MGIIILSHEPPRDITFSIGKAFCEFKKYDGIEEMPARTSAYIKQWTSKADGTLQVHWEYDETNASLGRHPAWFVHSGPLTSNSGLLLLLATPRATPDCTGHWAELLPGSAQAVFDEPSKIVQEMRCTPT